jgi:hypothetical protein
VAGRDAQPVNAAQLDRHPRRGHPIEAEIATNGQSFRSFRSVYDVLVVACNCIDRQ